jgi:hypothetical protein
LEWDGHEGERRCLGALVFGRKREDGKKKERIKRGWGALLAHINAVGVN